MLFCDTFMHSLLKQISFQRVGHCLLSCLCACNPGKPVHLCMWLAQINDFILFIVRNLQKTSLALSPGSNHPGARRLTTTSNTYSRDRIGQECHTVFEEGGNCPKRWLLSHNWCPIMWSIQWSDGSHNSNAIMTNRKHKLRPLLGQCISLWSLQSWVPWTKH